MWKDYSALCVTLKIKALHLFRIWGTTWHTTQCNIRGDLNIQQHYCENLRSHNQFSFHFEVYKYSFHLGRRYGNCTCTSLRRCTLLYTKGRNWYMLLSRWKWGYASCFYLFNLHIFLLIQPLFLNLFPIVHYRPVLLFFPWKCVMNILTLLLDFMHW